MEGSATTAPKPLHGRAKSFLTAAVALMCWGALVATQNLNPMLRSLSAFEETKKIIRNKSATDEATHVEIDASDTTNAATGQRFVGAPVREFRGQRKFDGRPRLQQSSSLSLRSPGPRNSAASLQDFLTNQPFYKRCSKWSVVTTIYEPSEAVKLMGTSSELVEWCMVIVADTKTSNKYTTEAGFTDHGRTHQVAFLSVADQMEIAKLVPFIDQTPFQSFARKNIGYLYAIWMGATVIFDFDDDNIVKTRDATSKPLWSGTELLHIYTDEEYDPMARHVSMLDTFKGRSFNPFPLMGATVSDAWPRGLPLSLINSKEARGQPGPLMMKEVKRSQVAVIQSTCDHDPDVDAIFRLTRPLPVTFDSGKASSMTVDIPQTHYSPYNAQATLHFPLAFWGLYLPMSVTGRVSDIWRSYIVQRLLRELKDDAHVMYSPPLVTQIRNAHDYTGDFVAEQHLYLRTEALLEFLDEWKPSIHDNLQSRVEDLWIHLYERGYVEFEDVEGIQLWLDALEQGNYTFPAVRDQGATFDVTRGGIEDRRQCAKQRLQNWKEPVPTMMNGSNFGALPLGHPTATNAPSKTVARLLLEYELEHPFPHSIDLICRAAAHHSPHELAILIESIDLYWPKCAGRVVLVLDRGDEQFAHDNIPSWVEVYYSQFAYGMPGRLGNQLFNMYSDQQGTSEYVAIIDTDTALVTPVTPDLIFNFHKMDKEVGSVPPIVLADTQYQKGFWSKGDNWMFQGDSNDWTFMVTLPIVFPRAMFPQYRAEVEAIHNNEFETTDLWQYFRTTMRGGWLAMSQFCLLGNWMVRHWKGAPFDLRTETSTPPIRYGVHLPYNKAVDFRPGGAKDPASFLAGGRRVIQDGLCELFCSDDWTPGTQELLHSFPKLESCSSLCPSPIAEPRIMYFMYERVPYGSTEQQIEVLAEHFEPFKSSLASLMAKNVTVA